MKLSEVLIKPIVTEKANAQQEKLRRYAFKVDKRANKLEIKKAIEEFYGVNVVDVNIKGIKSPYKKALVTVAEGDSIDLYANI
jgi:large subunit ribosomal protein L23